MSKRQLNLILIFITHLNILLMFKIGLLNVANSEYVEKICVKIHRLNKILKF